jgi:alpha-1,6-mannosyltransferase
VTERTRSVTERVYLSDGELRGSTVDLSHLELPPVLRPDARLSVLDITEFYGDTTGGIRTYLRQKSAYVEARPDLRQVLVLPSPRDHLAQSDGVRSYRLQGPKVPKQAPYRFMLATRTNRRIALHERPDVVEIGSPGFVPWITNLATRGLHTPLVAFWHSNFPRVLAPFPERENAFRRALWDLGWRYARQIDRQVAMSIVCSHFVADDLRAAGIDRVVRIPLGVDLAHFHPGRRAKREEVRERLGLPNGLVAGFVGRFAQEKEIELAIRAWPEIHQRTGATLALIGAGPMQERLEALADGADWARFLPYQSGREELADLLAALDLFVAPSSNETFGLAPLEAQASGTPVIAANRGGIGEQIEAGGAGGIFEAGSVASFREVAVKLLQSDLEALGARGRGYAEADHSWDTVFDRIFKVYEQVKADAHG